ncbi:hypothetical protein Tco_1159166, partial [Tanacetum coccineum]
MRSKNVLLYKSVEYFRDPLKVGGCRDGKECGSTEVDRRSTYKPPLDLNNEKYSKSLIHLFRPTCIRGMTGDSVIDVPALKRVDIGNFLAMPKPTGLAATDSSSGNDDSFALYALPNQPSPIVAISKLDEALKIDPKKHKDGCILWCPFSFLRLQLISHVEGAHATVLKLLKRVDIMFNDPSIKPHPLGIKTIELPNSGSWLSVVPNLTKQTEWVSLIELSLSLPSYVSYK